jgi:hypothetical protein
VTLVFLVGVACFVSCCAVAVHTVRAYRAAVPYAAPTWERETLQRAYTRAGVRLVALNIAVTIVACLLLWGLVATFGALVQ